MFVSTQSVKPLRFSRLALLAACLAGCLLAKQRPDEVVQAKWEELPALLTGRQAELVLVDGTYLRGRVRQVTADSIVLNVKATTNPSRFPPGLHHVPRDLWLRLRVQRHTKARFAGMVLGGLASLPLLQYLVRRGDFTASGDAIFSAGLISAFSYLGYRLGKSSGVRYFVVKVVPENPEPATPAAVSPEQPPPDAGPTG
jgi:hypothetical protein